MSIEFTGERVVPGRVDADLWNEHLARYAFSDRYCHGLRILDAGCGTGYGTHQLALNAQSVVGVDLAEDALAYAASEYARSNLRWVRSSCTNLPFSAGCFDVVVSFEVIEHLQQWADLIAEARRVLVPEGVFIVSTPNKSFYAKARADSGPNPFHEHEFELDEFRDALTRVFPHVVIAFENHAGCVLFESLHAAGIDARIDGFSGPEDANFYVAVCSAQAQPVASFVYVPEFANLLKERGTRIQSLETELQLKNAWLEEAQNKHADLVRLHTQQTQELQNNNTWAKELDTQLKASRQRIADLQDEAFAQHKAALAVAEGYENQLRKLETELQARTEWAQGAEARVQQEMDQLNGDLTRCVALLDKAEATVVERTNWALQLQRDLEHAQAQLALARASIWVKLGRIIKVGPELNP
jgi:SAM-dependent methyltransferase